MDILKKYLGKMLLEVVKDLVYRESIYLDYEYDGYKPIAYIIIDENEVEKYFE